MAPSNFILYRKLERFDDVGNIFKLIRLYRANECLWNPNSKGFHNLALKENAWSRIVRLFNNEFDVDQVKLQILSLRNYFEIERQAIERSKLEGKPYVPRHSYYDELQFLEASRVPTEEPKANGKCQIMCVTDDAFVVEASQDRLNSGNVECFLTPRLAKCMSYKMNSIQVMEPPTSKHEFDDAECLDDTPFLEALEEQNSKYLVYKLSVEKEFMEQPFEDDLELAEMAEMAKEVRSVSGNDRFYPTTYCVRCPKSGINYDCDACCDRFRDGVLDREREHGRDQRGNSRTESQACKCSEQLELLAQEKEGHRIAPAPDWPRPKFCGQVPRITTRLNRPLRMTHRKPNCNRRWQKNNAAMCQNLKEQMEADLIEQNNRNRQMIKLLTEDRSHDQESRDRSHDRESRDRSHDRESRDRSHDRESKDRSRDKMTKDKGHDHLKKNINRKDDRREERSCNPNCIKYRKPPEPPVEIEVEVEKPPRDDPCGICENCPDYNSMPYSPMRRPVTTINQGDDCDDYENSDCQPIFMLCPEARERVKCGGNSHNYTSDSEDFPVDRTRADYYKCYCPPEDVSLAPSLGNGKSASSFSEDRCCNPTSFKRGTDQKQATVKAADRKPPAQGEFCINITCDRIRKRSNQKPVEMQPKRALSYSDRRDFDKSMRQRKNDPRSQESCDSACEGKNKNYNARGQTSRGQRQKVDYDEGRKNDRNMNPKTQDWRASRPQAQNNDSCRPDCEGRPNERNINSRPEDRRASPNQRQQRDCEGIRSDRSRSQDRRPSPNQNKQQQDFCKPDCKGISIERRDINSRSQDRRATPNQRQQRECEGITSDRSRSQDRRPPPNQNRQQRDCCKPDCEGITSDRSMKPMSADRRAATNQRQQQDFCKPDCVGTIIMNDQSRYQDRRAKADPREQRDICKPDCEGITSDTIPRSRERRASQSQRQRQDVCPTWCDSDKNDIKPLDPATIDQCTSPYKINREMGNRESIDCSCPSDLVPRRENPRQMEANMAIYQRTDPNIIECPDRKKADQPITDRWESKESKPTKSPRASVRPNPDDKCACPNALRAKSEDDKEGNNDSFNTKPGRIFDYRQPVMADANKRYEPSCYCDENVEKQRKMTYADDESGAKMAQIEPNSKTNEDDDCVCEDQQETPKRSDPADRENVGQPPTSRSGRQYRMPASEDCLCSSDENARKQRSQRKPAPNDDCECDDSKIRSGENKNRYDPRKRQDNYNNQREQQQKSRQNVKPCVPEKCLEELTQCIDKEQSRKETAAEQKENDCTCSVDTLSQQKSEAKQEDACICVEVACETDLDMTLHDRNNANDAEDCEESKAKEPDHKYELCCGCSVGSEDAALLSPDDFMDSGKCNDPSCTAVLAAVRKPPPKRKSAPVVKPVPKRESKVESPVVKPRPKPKRLSNCKPEKTPLLDRKCPTACKPLKPANPYVTNANTANKSKEPELSSDCECSENEQKVDASPFLKAHRETNNARVQDEKVLLLRDEMKRTGVYQVEQNGRRQSTIPKCSCDPKMERQRSGFESFAWARLSHPATQLQPNNGRSFFHQSLGRVFLPDHHLSPFNKLLVEQAGPSGRQPAYNLKLAPRSQQKKNVVTARPFKTVPKPSFKTHTSSYMADDEDGPFKHPFRDLNFNASKREVNILFPPVQGFRPSKHSFTQDQLKSKSRKSIHKHTGPPPPIKPRRTIR